MTYKKGDIVLMPFPFTDTLNSKRRPALIISNEQHHSLYDKIICLAITSQAGKDRYEYDIVEPLRTGLVKENSWIVIDKVFSTEDKYITKKLGQLDGLQLIEVENMFLKIIKD